MAVFSISEAIARIEALPDKVADAGVNIMRIEVPVGPTGALKMSVSKEYAGKWVRIIAPHVPYSVYVHEGRGPVFPRKGRGIAWMGYAGRQTSIHSDDAGMFYVRRYAGPAAENRFCDRTADKLNSMHFSL